MLCSLGGHLASVLAANTDVRCRLGLVGARLTDLKEARAEAAAMLLSATMPPASNACVASSRMLLL